MATVNQKQKMRLKYAYRKCFHDLLNNPRRSRIVYGTGTIYMLSRSDTATTAATNQHLVDFFPPSVIRGNRSGEY